MLFVIDRVQFFFFGICFVLCLDFGRVLCIFLCKHILGVFVFLFAADYRNEAEVGEALTEAFTTGLVKREDLFITTKVQTPFIAKLHSCDLK